MADQLLSQSDIDALVKDMAGKSEGSPGGGKADAPKAVAREASQSFEEASPPTTVTEVSLRGVVSQEPSRGRDVASESVGSLEAKILDLTQRLSAVEATVGRLEGLEKRMAGSANAGQVSPEQLQAMVKRIQDLGQEIKNISARLQGTLGYDAYHTFKCDKCQTQGVVATVFRCTECGHQTWRGWWPRKQAESR